MRVARLLVRVACVVYFLWFIGGARRLMLDADRHGFDRAAGLLSFDMPEVQSTPRRLSVLWIENTLDCRMWAYYCDIRKAMARLHNLCTPHGAQTCIGGRAQFEPDVAVVGPRFSINIASEDEGLGFDRNRFASLPLLVLQNKMYTPSGWKEIVGNRTAKIAWVRAAGTAAAFTWLTKHHEFTRASKVPHHWMPFGVNADVFGAQAGKVGPALQPYDVGFTGASGKDKYPERAALLLALRSMNISTFLGEWSQTALNRADPRSWKAGSTREYAAQLARARIWLSTLGPSNIVGTRYFEVLASGTTLLLCSSPPPGTWVYDGLFQDGIHVVFFNGVEDMKVKVRHYLADEQARQRIVSNALALVQRVHTWDARARFISHVAELAIIRARGSLKPLARYVPPPDAVPANHSSFIGCFLRADRKEEGLREPPRSRNKRRLFRYTVASCVHACRSLGVQGALAAVTGGGFAFGNGHSHARCMCAAGSANASSWAGDLESDAVDSGTKPKKLQPPPGWLQRADSECATTCSLKDSRPCGGVRAYAFFRTSSD